VSLVCPGSVKDLSIHDCFVGNIEPTCQQTSSACRNGWVSNESIEGIPFP